MKKIITGTYSAGYSLNSHYTLVDIEASGRILGSGLTATARADVRNAGTIADSTLGAWGVSLAMGGDVDKSGDRLIAGDVGYSGADPSNPGGTGGAGGGGVGVLLQGDAATLRNIAAIAGGAGGRAGYGGAKDGPSLLRSQAFTAAIAGFTANGRQQLDLRDIGFVDADQATFSGTAGGGVLTVTDGTDTARINLVGDYELRVLRVLRG